MQHKKTLLIFVLVILAGASACKKENPMAGRLPDLYVTVVKFYTTNAVAAVRPLDVRVNGQYYSVLYNNGAPSCDNVDFMALYLPVGKVTVEVPGKNGAADRVVTFEVTAIRTQCTFFNIQ